MQQSKQPNWKRPYRKQLMERIQPEMKKIPVMWLVKSTKNDIFLLDLPSKEAIVATTPDKKKISIFKTFLQMCVIHWISICI